MYKIELDQTICRIIKKFYQFGIWRSEDESAYRKTAWKLFYLIFYILFVILFVISSAVSDNKSESLFLSNVSISLNVLFLKLTYLLWKKQEILGFLNTRIFTHSIEDRYEFEEHNRKINTFLKFCRVYLSVLGCGIIFASFSSLPIFTSEKKLPLLISFSLDWQYSEIIYWIAHFFVQLGMCCSYLLNFLSVLIWYIMLVFSIEYKVLGNKLRHLGMDKCTKKQNQKILKSAPLTSFSDDLQRLIKGHQEIHESVERFISCFSKLFFAQIATSGISICVATYNLAYSSQENVFQTGIFICMALYGFFEIFLLMYLANDITLTHNRLSYCLFESNWIEQPESSKKCMIIFCEMVKHPQQLIILIYPLNLETFCRILNGAYSMFNVLKSFK